MVDVSEDFASAEAARWKNKCLETLDANEKFAGRARGRVGDLARLLGRLTRAIPTGKANAGVIRDLSRLAEALEGRHFDEALNRDIRSGYEHLLEVIAGHEHEQAALRAALDDAVGELEKLPASWALKRRLKKFRKSLNKGDNASASQLVEGLRDVQKKALKSLHAGAEDVQPPPRPAPESSAHEDPGTVPGATARDSVPELSAGVLPGATDWSGVQQILMRLLDRIETLRESTEQLQSLRGEVDAGIDELSLVPVLEQVRELFDTSVEGLRSEYRLFLDAIDRRLGGLLSSLDTVQTRDQAGRVRRVEFSRGVESGFAEIRAQADAAENLGDLKVSIDQQLEHLGGMLSRYCVNSDADAEQNQAELQALRKRLAELESQSQAARRQMQQQHWLAHTDTLTSLPNRRALDERLEHEFAQWRRYQAPLSVAMLDIDHFKQVNDVHGHAGGDRALAFLGALIKQRIRQVDFAARFGGEEFVLLMPSTALEQAAEMLEQLRGFIEASSITHQGKVLRITASFGLTEVRAEDEPAAAMERADAALYNAKQEGRNRVCRA